MCSVYKPDKGDMLDKNTLPPIPCMRPEKVYKLAKKGPKVYIIAMIGHYRDIYLYNDCGIAFK